MGHIAGFAAGLHALGHAARWPSPGDDRASAATLGPTRRFRPSIFADTWELARALFPDGRPADILHAWTPREHVRRAVERCRREMPAARLVVHLEDNEEHLTARFTGEDFSRPARAARRRTRRPPARASFPPARVSPLPAVGGRDDGHHRAAGGFRAVGVPFAEWWPGVDFDAYHPGAAGPGVARLAGYPDRRRKSCVTRAAAISPTAARCKACTRRCFCSTGAARPAG